MAQRPQVILNMFTSIDGRITTAPGRNVSEWTALGLDANANEITHRLYDELNCDCLVSGSETLHVWGGDPVELDEPVYWPKKSKAFVVFDGRGRINWTQTDGLLVVTREDAPAAYFDQLREKRIRHIAAGRGERIDLPMALEKLGELGFRRIGLTGGGGLNGAMLREGLIDEFSVVVAPVAVGGRFTPTLFDCPDLQDAGGLTELELLASNVIEGRLVRMHYKKKRRSDAG